MKTPVWIGLLGVAIVAVGVDAFGTDETSDPAPVIEGVPAQPVRLFPDNLYTASFPSETRGVIAGYFGTLLRSDDGGKTWTRQQLPVKELIRRMSFADASHGWAVGHRGSILSTRDGGETWTVQRDGDGINLRAVAAADTHTVYAVGHEALLLRSTDGGLSWTQQELQGYTGRDPPRLHGVVALTPERAVAVGEFGVVAATQDGGQLWHTVPGAGRGTLTAIDAGGGRIIAVGLDGAAFEIYWPTEPESEEASEVTDEPLETAEAEDEAQEESAPDWLPELRPLDAGTEQHLFDLVLGASGDGLAVGDRTLLRFEGGSFASADAHESLALDFEWLGGAALGPDASLWAVGRAGLIARSGGGGASFERAIRWSDVEIAATSTAEDAEKEEP